MRRRVAWSDEAERDLRAISWPDAAWIAIASEVARYAEHGVGDLRRVALSSGQITPILFLPGYRVAFAYDRTTQTLWVRWVWRIAPP
jgi:hypothetical protein